MDSLPPKTDLETKAVLKELVNAHKKLAELKGELSSIINPSVLIETLFLQEAKASSEIENIVTTDDELFKAKVGEKFIDPKAKEIARYALAMNKGFEKLSSTGILSTNLIINIQETIEENKSGFRKVPGTALRDERTGEIIYQPPQDQHEIKQLMSDLDKFINEDALCDLDPLIKMALIHFQFESIHPFYDGNGRTGRIINILYLVQQGLLNYPVLYLSSYIVAEKSTYYQLLQEVRSNDLWEEWILYILKGVAVTAKLTLDIVHEIKTLMLATKHALREKLPKIYSQELLNCIFRNPYTKSEFVEREVAVSRQTASRYLKLLEEYGFLKLVKTGKTNYYLNTHLIECLMEKYK